MSEYVYKQQNNKTTPLIIIQRHTYICVHMYPPATTPSPKYLNTPYNIHIYTYINNLTNPHIYTINPKTSATTKPRP